MIYFFFNHCVIAAFFWLLQHKDDEDYNYDSWYCYALYLALDALCYGIFKSHGAAYCIGLLPDIQEVGVAYCDGWKDMVGYL